MDNNPNQNGQNNNNRPPHQNILVFLIAGLVTLVLMSYFMRIITGGSEKEISYNEFLAMVASGEVKSVEIDTDTIVITPKTSPSQGNSYLYGTGSTVTYYTGKLEEDETLTQRLIAAGVDVSGKIEDSSGILISFLATYILPILLMWGLLSLLFRRVGKGSGIMGVGKSNAKIYVEKETGITFKDVAGEDEAKESLVEVVDFLHNPAKYSKIGAKLPKGALLVGPPGTGKTLLAKAVAGEAHVPFFSLAGSDFIEMYVGVGASRVRDLFKEASKHAPCIIFIDEIDAIGRSRDSKYGGGNEEREQTLNQLLSEMDGFDSSKGVLILAATNRPEILDKALLRPGRFDRRIIVDKPDLKGRTAILKVHSKNVLMDETVDLEAISLATSGAVGADLANMINEAAINAVKDGREFVSQKDLFEAVEQVLLGKEKKDRIMSQQERKIVSYHEIGHALVTAVQKNTEPIQKITIIPRTNGALGYVMNVPEEEKYLQTKSELRERIVTCLGGRAAEEIVFDDITTGAANDIEQATSLAKNMITRFGMNDRFGMMGLATIENQYLGGGARMDCSDETAALVDEEIKNLLKTCYEEAKQIILDNRDCLDQLAEYLLKQETITGKEFMHIYCELKGIPEPEEKTYDGILKEEEKKRQTVSDTETDTDNESSSNEIEENESPDVSTSSEDKSKTSDTSPENAWMVDTVLNNGDNNEDNNIKNQTNNTVIISETLYQPFESPQTSVMDSTKKPTPSSEEKTEQADSEDNKSDSDNKPQGRFSGTSI